MLNRWSKRWKRRKENGGENLVMRREKSEKGRKEKGKRGEETRRGCTEEGKRKGSKESEKRRGVQEKIKGGGRVSEMKEKLGSAEQTEERIEK